MANAAEKKAAAARASASSFYLPVVLILNIIYVLILVFQRDAFTRNRAVLTAIIWALTVFAYNGIVENHATSTSAPKKTGKAGGSDPIAGGASLDLLGLVAVAQFGAVLVSEKFYWLLAVLPLWGAWKGYQMIYGVKNSLSSMTGGGQAAAEPEKVDEATAERRKKRAEKRRQKAGR